MEKNDIFRFLITAQGELGEKYTPAPTKTPKAAATPGAALEALLAEQDDEEIFDDAPDVSADFARLKSPAEYGQEPQQPLTADFASNADGGATLLRWPRLARAAVVPDTVCGLPVTEIAPTAFAATHLPAECFAGFYSSPVSFSIFCMREGRHSTTEQTDEGGPTGIRLPRTIRRIGPYAFWRCQRLKSIEIPAGVEELPAGCFGECSVLEKVLLPQTLRVIGWQPKPTDQVMPDVGVFAGCHALKELTLPSGVEALGAHTFNSTGLVRLRVADSARATWSRAVTVASTAFDHTAALLWLEKCTPGGETVYVLGLPPARDKILAGDSRFGRLLRIPVDFFSHPPQYFDALAQEAFRLDFSGRMALARLEYPVGLTEETRAWYTGLLAEYFDRAPQFMPDASGEAAYTALFDFLQKLPSLTAAQMSGILRTAGQLGLSAELMSRMLAVRTQAFSTVTGFEDLELD